MLKKQTAISIDACVAQHQGDRAEQQDRVALLSHPSGDVVLAVVADGMGGHAGGALAAQQVIHTARGNFERYFVRHESPQQLFEANINEAHMLIKALRFVNEKDPHSTAVMLLLQSNKATWAHCGDSRLYHFRGKRLISRTTDHSYVEFLVANGLLSPNEAEKHPRRNVLVTSLGGIEAPYIDYGEANDLRAGDAFLLCSDGLWDYFTDAELGLVVTKLSARRACDALIAQARVRAQGIGDNVSVAVLKLIGNPPPTRPTDSRKRRGTSKSFRRHKPADAK